MLHFALLMIPANNRHELESVSTPRPGRVVMVSELAHFLAVFTTGQEISAELCTAGLPVEQDACSPARCGLITTRAPIPGFLWPR